MIDTNQIIQGDARNVLADLPENSVHTVMTSPPYWNLRDYDHADQLGREESADEYVSNLADVFDEVGRVLRPDGSLWLNLGDTYDDKDLQQIPARVALELQSRGWLLRNRVTWAKPNPMPQSVKDRLNDTTEAIFHFVRDKSYWYDLDAIREPHSDAVRKAYERTTTKQRTEAKGNAGSAPERNDSGGDYTGDNNAAIDPAGKNPGDVFKVTTKPFPDAHFAVYPPELCEKPIKATCPPTVCAECGTPYERDVERTTSYQSNQSKAGNDPTGGKHASNRDRNDTDSGSGHDIRKGPTTVAVETKGWIKPCECDTDDTDRGIALDPFAGAGTTCLKAKELGRRFVGIELNPEYADMARARVGLSPQNPSNVRDDDAQAGLEAYAGDD